MLTDQIAEDLKGAMKAKDEAALRALRMLRSELRYREVEARRALRPEEEWASVKAALQRRSDAAEQFRAGGREDLASAEDAEAVILRRYLPQQLSEDEVRARIEAAIDEAKPTGPKDFGRVMKAAMSQMAGRADGGTVSALVKQRLSSLS